MIRQKKKAGGGNRTAFQSTQYYNNTSYKELNDYLLAAEAHCRWFPNGRRQGRNWRVGSLEGEPGSSLSICQETGQWIDFATNDSGGDLISLYKKMRGLSSKAEASHELLRGMLEIAPSARASQNKVAQNAEADKRKNRKRALEIWCEAQDIEGTPAEKYLRNRRLSHTADMPLKYHPACPCRESKHPAMIALMTDIETNASVGIHRTFITQDGEKADIESPKMMMGRAKNAVIRLTPDEDVTMGLGIVEGIENGLTILGLGWGPIWVALSANGVAEFPVLPGIEALTIFADNDKAGLDAARQCADSWWRDGKETIIRTPSVQGGDWNDAVRGA